jgi:uncharacterized protein (TIGR02452 family)
MNKLAQLARRVSTAVQAQEYYLPNGTVVGFGYDVVTSRNLTEYFPPKEMKTISRHLTGSGDTLPAYDSFQVDWKLKTTVQAIYEEVDSNPEIHVAALNFASARKPGGGWLSGQKAQEESLARASSLVSTLSQRMCEEFYQSEQVKGSIAQQEVLRNGLIFSEGVPFFVNETTGEFCHPRICSVITCAAVNYSRREIRSALSPEQVENIMDIRIRNVFAIAVRKQVQILVVGAWGTGVYGNDIGMISRLFFKHTNQTFHGCFERVVFAIPDQTTMQEFRENFK